MNELTKQIFKELDLLPDEEFYIKEFDGNNKYKITKDLYFKVKSPENNHWFNTSQNIADLVTGKLTIKKIKKPTEDDLVVLKYAKLCGAKYIAQDKNGDNFMYFQRPYKNKADDEGSYILAIWTNDDSDFLAINAPISFISWEDDEPVCIERYV